VRAIKRQWGRPRGRIRPSRGADFGYCATPGGQISLPAPSVKNPICSRADMEVGARAEIFSSIREVI
jgi:hypothetical protein